MTILHAQTLAHLCVYAEVLEACVNQIHLATIRAQVSTDYPIKTLDEQGHYAYLGNAGELCDLSYAWIKPIVLDEKRDFRLLLDMYLGAYLERKTLEG